MNSNNGYIFPKCTNGKLYKTILGYHLIFGNKKTTKIYDSHPNLIAHFWSKEYVDLQNINYPNTKEISYLGPGSYFVIIDIGKIVDHNTVYSPTINMEFKIISGDIIGWTTIGKWFPPWFENVDESENIKYLG